MSAHVRSKAELFFFFRLLIFVRIESKERSPRFKHTEVKLRTRIHVFTNSAY